MRLPNFLTLPNFPVLPMTATGRVRDAFADPKRANGALLLTLAAYVLVWTAYGTIAKGTQGLHFDMLEVIAWSRDLSLGYLKHPPLAATVAWAWFGIFPVAEWSYYLLAMTMPALALWIVWHLSADYLDADKRIAGLALLMLVPFFNFHALKFNVNTVLIPLWAATTLWFLRSVRTRSPLYAALAGIGAAGSMLGKYWSIFLLAGLVAAVLADRRRAAYFKSAAPWITIVTGFVVLLPHLVWLRNNDFAPFTYAMSIHGDKPFIDTLMAALGYLAGSVGYVALPVILVLIAARPSRATLADMIWPADAERRLAAAAFWGPFLLPAVGALVSGTEITSLWSMSAWTLLPVLLLSSPAIASATTWRPLDTRRVLLLAAALPLVMLVISPAIAIMTRRDGPPPPAVQSPLLAAEVERLWHEAIPAPLRYVGGDGDILLGVVAYASDRPHALLPGIAAPGEAELRRAGMVLLCFTGDAPCLNAAKNAAMKVAGSADSRTTQTAISQKSWGKVLSARNYTVIIVPPRL
jgi:4-amino-4-deoxy-L-arabinose transferase-like glycosyltransferase